MSLESINHNHSSFITKISWSAISSGALIAFGMTLLFNLLFLSVGLKLNDVSSESVNNISVMVPFIYIAGGFALLYIAGIITGKILKSAYLEQHFSFIDNKQKQINNVKMTNKAACFGALHGFISWVVYLMINLLFVSLLAQATPIESPFMYSANEHNISEEIKEKPSMDDNSTDKYKEGLPPENDINKKFERTEDMSNSAMLIFLIFTSGAAAFILGGWNGCKIKYLQSTL